MFRNHSTSENAIYNFFDKNLRAYKPITYSYELLKDTKILFLYGDRDWCPIKHAQDLQRLLPDNVEIETVSSSGHVIYGDNHNEMIDKILFYANNEGYIKLEETPIDISDEKPGEKK